MDKYIKIKESALKDMIKKSLNEVMGELNRDTKSKINEFHKIFTFGKYKGLDKTKVIQEDPEYCVWLYRKMQYSPFTDNQLGILDVSYYKRFKIFPIKSYTTPKYARIRGVLVKDMTAEQLTYVYENGSDEFKWLIKQEHDNRGWHRSASNGGAPAFQTDDIGDAAWFNN